MNFSRILKMNPNHDPDDGRFTYANGYRPKVGELVRVHAPEEDTHHEIATVTELDHMGEKGRIGVQLSDEWNGEFMSLDKHSYTPAHDPDYDEIDADREVRALSPRERARADEEDRRFREFVATLDAKKVLKFNPNHSPENGRFVSGTAGGKQFRVHVPGYMNPSKVRGQISFARALEGIKVNMPTLFNRTATKEDMATTDLDTAGKLPPATLPKKRGLGAVLKYNHHHDAAGRFASGAGRVDDQLDAAFEAALDGKANFRHEVARIVDEQSRPNPTSVDQHLHLRALRRHAEGKGPHPDDKDLPEGVHVVDREHADGSYMSLRELFGFRKKQRA